MPTLLCRLKICICKFRFRFQEKAAVYFPVRPDPMLSRPTHRARYIEHGKEDDFFNVSDLFAVDRASVFP